jgi:hypothetical protein
MATFSLWVRSKITYFEYSLFLTACVFHFLQEKRLEEQVATNADKCSDDSNTVHRPGDDPHKECGNARGSNVRYYPTWKHSPLKDYWLLITD